MQNLYRNIYRVYYFFRYEHSAFTPLSRPGKIYIFGGADPAGSRNDLQVFDTTTEIWSNVTATGTPPSPRTYHNGVCIEDTLIVYSGGNYLAINDYYFKQYILINLL